MIKAVFFDIDGTLVSFKTHLVPDSTHKALNMLREQGIKVFVSTGRSPTHLAPLKNILDFEFDGYVSTNGQYCFCGDTVIRKQCLDKSDLQSFREYLKINDNLCEFIELDYQYANREPYKDETILSLGNTIPKPAVDSLDRLEKYDTYQMCLFVPTEDEKAALEYLPNSRAVRWHPVFADIIPASGGKGVGIKAMLDYFGYTTDECIAFGDGGNDAEMIVAAGIGVAMGNANDDLKSVSDYVTDTVDNDGVFKALKHFGII